MILLIGQAMASMDGSILAVAAPSLKLSLGASGGQLQLIVAMYALAFGTLVVTGARLGATLGYRRVFIWGLAAFTAASLAAGLAPSASALVAARAVQGAAAALMTPQVLSIIQLRYRAERRARAIGAYSMILAVGVAVGQLLGGLLTSLQLLPAAWRPALLINAPIGALLLLGARRWLPAMEAGDGQRLDLGGVALLAVALLALVLPLTFGRQAHWPAWVWPSLAVCGGAGVAFARLERALVDRRLRPLLDVRLVDLPGVGAGVLAVLLIMACYSGFLITLTLFLQSEPLAFSPLHAGATFAVYASGFATASLTWTRMPARHQAKLPAAGSLAMGAALLGVGLASAGGQWSPRSHDAAAVRRRHRSCVGVLASRQPAHRVGWRRQRRRHERVHPHRQPRRPGDRGGRLHRHLPKSCARSSRIWVRGDHRRARRLRATHRGVCESRRRAGPRGRAGR